MKVAYFDCFAGASGDMILGSLMDAGLSLEELRGEIAKLGLSNYYIDRKKVVKGGLSGSQALVSVDDSAHSHHHRHLHHLKEIIEKSGLDDRVKQKSISIFTALAEAEAMVHRTTVDKIHFHEVGAMDSIIDVVGSVAGLAAMGIEKVFCSPLHVGSGTVECAHGTLPVPAPATCELVKGRPVYSTGLRGELLTPTGAAILTTLAEEFGPMPVMTLDTIGYGAGTSDLSIPNLLRIAIGTSQAHTNDRPREWVAVAETNIDDMNPQMYDYLIEKMLGMGALDVFLVPIQMKKNRPGTLISVVCHPELTGRFAEFLMRETTTIGVRWRIDERIKADRDIRKVPTKYGLMRFKVAHLGSTVINAVPEYDDCKRVALEQAIPLKVVMEEARKTKIDSEVLEQ